MTETTFTEAELDAFERGLARLHRGRVVPVVRGGDGSDDGSGGDDGAQGGAGGGSQEDDDDAPGGGDDGGSETLSLDEARKLRRENAQLRKRAKEAEGKVSERERADLSEQERLKKDRDSEAEKAARLEEENRLLRGSAIATRLGAIDGEAVAALLKWSQIDDPSDNGQVEQAIKDFKKERPRLFSESDGDGKGREREGADGGAGRRNGSGAVAGDRAATRPGIGTLRQAYDNATK